ncbi:MAG: PPC domain-containing protein [Fimbriiglobus sp.]
MNFSRVLTALFLLSATSFAASPNLGGIVPRGAQRGTEVTMVFGGASLTDTQEVLTYYPGITVTKFEVLNPNTVRVFAKIAPDCRLGEHGFRLRTASGISDFRTFWVGALPTTEEVEPNTEFDKAQVVSLNTTVHGTVNTEDVDHFVVECKKGQRLSVEVEAMRLGVQMWDPYVAILDSKRFEIAMNDDSPMLAQDCGCSVLIPADGKYTIQIRDSAYGGNGACNYRLHIGNFPRPTAVLPLGGKPGEEVEFRFLGDPLGEIKQKIKLPAPADPLFRLHCTTAEGISPTGFAARVNDLPGVVEPGTNLTMQTATPGTAPGAFHGTISKPGETKYFKFAAKKGQAFDIHCYARRAGSPLDSVMHISRADNGAYLAGSDDVTGPDSYIRFGVPEDKEYVVWVHDHLRKGGPDYTFRIEITPVAAKTTTNIPKADGNNVSNQDRQSITVPKGGRYATLINVNRADWAGPAAIGFDKLPGGIAPAMDVVDPGQGSVPVVFEARPDAPLAATLTQVLANPTNTKVVAPSRVDLDVNFNIGLNNTPFHRHFADRIAVSVTEAAPFSIDVIEPKAAVPQNGSLNVKVVAKRAPNFKGPIVVLPLFTPPGMGIIGSTTIPENATEATVLVNAQPNAAPRKWKTCFTAYGNAGQGTVWTSSQLFTLEVSTPIVAFAQERAAVEQGQKANVFSKVVISTPFEGKAIVKLIGLPAKATTPDKELTKDSKELVCEVATDKVTPAGKHSVFFQVIVPINGEMVVHNVGGGEFRVDVPIPPKVTATTPPPAAKPAAPPAPAAAKPLSRLEQLRKEQEEREKAGQPATPPAKPPEKKG